MHHTWALTNLNERRSMGPIVVCEHAICELFGGYIRNDHPDPQGAVEGAIERLGLVRTPLTIDALHRASVAYLSYRDANRGKTKTSPLPDFYIGAQAASLDVPLLTANPRDFTNRFPGLRVVSPP